MKKEIQTTKKVKVIGEQTYINPDTGEVEKFQVTSIEERDFNFTKIWMQNFIATLDLIGNKKSKVAYWIIDNLNKENQITMTQRQIAEATGVSYPVVNETIQCLIQADFLIQKNWGVYLINPNIIFKGSRNSRLNILNTYVDTAKEQKEQLSEEEKKEKKLNNLINTITQLQLEAKKLQDEIQENKKNKSEEETTTLDKLLQQKENNFQKINATNIELKQLKINERNINIRIEEEKQKVVNENQF